MTSPYLHCYVVASSAIVVQGFWIDHWQLHVCLPVARLRNNIEGFVALIQTVAFHSKVELPVIQLQSVVRSVRISLTVFAAQTEEAKKIAPQV